MGVDWTSVLAFLGVIVPSVIVAWTTTLKMRSDNRAAEDTRVERLEERVDQLECDRDSERAARRRAESRTHTVTMSLSEALGYIGRIMAWIDSGAKPPAPTAPDIAALQAVLVGPPDPR